MLTQLGFLALLPNSYKTNDNSDYLVFYAPVAQNIVAGHGLVMDGKLPSRYPPGFPAFLAGVFYAADHLSLNRDTAITVSNILATALGCVLVFFVTISIFSDRVALIAALLWMTYPFDLWLVKQPNSEVPFIVIFSAGVLLYLRGLKASKAYWFALAGIALGLSALIRPIALFIPVLLAFLLLVHRQLPPSKRFAYGVLLVLTFAAVILPWELELKSYTGHFAPLSTGGPVSIVDGLTFPTKFGHTRGRAWVPERAIDIAYRIREDNPPPQTTRSIAKSLVTEFHDDPVPVIEIGVLKVARSWYGADAMRHETPIAIIQLFYFLLIAPGIFLAWKRYPEKRFELSFPLILVLYFWAMTVLVLSILRYMVPVMPFLLMFAAVLIDSLIFRSRLKKTV
jgi:4-amino-4-deoxy-L-arabinose transferase-like glycosyltransferase